MLLKGCGILGCLMCMIIALIVGGVTVWLLYPYLEEHGYTPFDFREEAIVISETTAKTAGNVAEILKKSSAEKDKKVIENLED